MKQPTIGEMPLRGFLYFALMILFIYVEKYFDIYLKPYIATLIMDETLQELVLLTIEITPFMAATIAVMLGNYTVIQFVAAIASSSIFVFSEASKVVYHVFIIVFTEHKEKRDPLAALVFVYLIWAFTMHISWSLKSVHKALSVVWISVLDCKQYYTSYFRQDATQQCKMGAEAKQTKNCTTIIMIKKIQTKEGQREVEKPVTQTRIENVYIEEVTDETQKLKKETSALRLRKPSLELEKEGQQVTEEQFKINEQKVNFPRSIMNKQNLKMDVKQQQLYTAQQKLKDDHQELNMNQEQLKNAPEEKAYNTRSMDTTALNDIHQLQEQTSAQFHNTNMYTDSPKEGRPKEKACNTRPMNMTAPNEIHPEEPPSTQGPRKEKAWNARSINTRGQNELRHLEEQPTAQSYNTKMYTNPPKQEHREMKPINTKPMNTRGQNKIRHLREQATTQFHNAIVQELLKDIYNLKQEKGDLQKKIEELLEKIKVGEDKEKETVQRLQCEGQLCDMNCVSLAILWICKHKLESMNFFCCAPQFVTLITLHALLEGKLPHMPRCGYFMNTLQNVEIVRKVYECEMNGELEINEAWETLMKMNERVCILAKWNAQGEGHVVVCDLDTRTSKTKDGKVMFHDPQALPSSGWREAEMSLQKFIEYLNNVSLMLYTVDLEGFNRIMVYYKDVLHITELPHSCPRIE